MSYESLTSEPVALVMKLESQKQIIVLLDN